MKLRPSKKEKQKIEIGLSWKEEIFGEKLEAEINVSCEKPCLDALPEEESFPKEKKPKEIRFSFD
ncbi:MAG: hypothetical protein WA151_09180 [Desulfatirhabdiaceae bacterium]